MSDERNATAQWAHDMSNQRIRNLEAQLAERNLVVEQLQTALHVQYTQCVAATAERDRARQQLETAHVVANHNAKLAEAAEAKLADVDAYGVEQWNRGLTEGDCGGCQTFEEWRDNCCRREEKYE